MAGTGTGPARPGTREMENTASPGREVEGRDHSLSLSIPVRVRSQRLSERCAQTSIPEQSLRETWDVQDGIASEVEEGSGWCGLPTSAFRSLEDHSTRSAWAK